MPADSTAATQPERWIPEGLRILLDTNPRHHKMVERAFWTGTRHGKPYVTVDPAMRSGEPCVNGTRVPVESVADAVWLDGGVEAAMEDFDLGRHDVLVACWYAGSYGLPGRRGFASARTWRDRWGAWAERVHDSLWRTSELDPSVIEPPPSRESST